MTYYVLDRMGYLEHTTSEPSERSTIYAPSLEPKDGYTLRYIGGEWIEETLEQKALNIKYSTKVPNSITKVQAMRAMKNTDVDIALGTSMWTAFKALLSTNTDANDEWTLALDLDRNHPLVVSLAPTLGKTEAQLNDLFILGATL